MARKGKQSKAIIRQDNGSLLSDEQLELLATRLGEKEIEAREKLQVIRDLFPRNLEELLMMGRVPANMIVPLADYITWMQAGNDDIDLAEVQLLALLRLLIGKDGEARYETLAAYEANREKKEAEVEGEI